MVLRWFTSSGEARLAALLASPVRARPAPRPAPRPRAAPAAARAPSSPGMQIKPSSAPHSRGSGSRAMAPCRRLWSGVPVWEGKVALTGQTSWCWAGARLAISEQTSAQASALG